MLVTVSEEKKALMAELHRLGMREHVSLVPRMTERQVREMSAFLEREKEARSFERSERF